MAALTCVPKIRTVKVGIKVLISVQCQTFSSVSVEKLLLKQNFSFEFNV